MIRLGILSLSHPHATGNHLPALKYIQDMIKITAIYHHDKTVAKQWVDLFDAEYVPTKEDLLSHTNVDAVLITSINSNHAADCVMAAKAHKDIFCDKPIAISDIEISSILDAVNHYGIRFITTFPLRFNHSLQSLRSMILDGKLGKVMAIMATNHGCMYESEKPESVPMWVRNPKENGGGCVIDHAVHVADIMRWITGAEFETVKLEAGNYLRSGIPGEDIGVLHGMMTDGVIYQIDCSWSRTARYPMWGDVTFRIVGTKGTASLDLYNSHRLELYSSDGKIESHYPFYLIREHGDIFLDYVSHIEKGTPLFSANAVDGARAIELVLAAYKSFGTAKTVTVNSYRK